jgi:hypothetical protein
MWMVSHLGAEPQRQSVSVLEGYSVGYSVEPPIPIMADVCVLFQPKVCGGGGTHRAV